MTHKLVIKPSRRKGFEEGKRSVNLEPKVSQMLPHEYIMLEYEGFRRCWESRCGKENGEGK